MTAAVQEPEPPVERVLGVGALGDIDDPAKKFTAAEQAVLVAQAEGVPVETGTVAPAVAPTTVAATPVQPEGVPANG